MFWLICNVFSMTKVTNKSSGVLEDCRWLHCLLIFGISFCRTDKKRLWALWRYNNSLYSHFNCNDTSGQVSFGSAGGTYPVTIIHPEEQTFTIRVNNYTAIDVVRKLLELNHLPFNVTKSNLSSKDGWLNEVEIRWKPPLSPICNSVKDCDDWPHSTCHTMKGGTKRCLCNTEFRWDPSNFNCTPG